jgi:putative RecB family exonuclease
VRISYSRISAYLTCPQLYRLQYVDRVSVPTAPALHFGAAIHSALDFMYAPRNLRTPSLEEVIESFVSAWRARADDIDEKHRQTYFDQGVAILTRHYHRHAERGGARTTAATEQFFNIPFDSSHTLAGRIDRVDVLPDERLEIIDYKTSRSMPPPREMERNTQLAIYRMAADHLYPGRQVTTTLLYLLHDYEMQLTQSEDFLAEQRGQIRDVIARIEREDFDPNPGKYCDWCAYRAHCPLFRAPVEPADLDVDIRAALQEYVAAGESEKEAQERKRHAQSLIHSYLDQCDTETVAAGGYQAARRVYRRVKCWDVPRLREILQPLNLWDAVTQVSSAAVKELLDSSELTADHRRAVEGAAEYTESHQLRVKSLAPERDDLEETAE